MTEAMTAERLGSGTVPVLGTPAVLALVESAAVAAVSAELSEAETTVGTSVELEHVAPTAVGGTVTATVGLVAIEGRKLRFTFEVTDAAGPVARGSHTRAIVERDRFLSEADRRLS